MRYTFDVYKFEPDISKDSKRLHTTTNLDELLSSDVTHPFFVKVTDNLADEGRGKFIRSLTKPEHIEEFRCEMEHAQSVKSQHKDGPMEAVLDEIRKTHLRSEPWDPFDERETDIHVVHGKENLGMKKGEVKLVMAGSGVGKSTFAEKTREEVAEAVNPRHHKAFMVIGEQELQWVDAMSRIRRYREQPEAWKGAIEAQIRKYLDRNGGKDAEAQELRKALWYMEYLVLYVENGCEPLPLEVTARIQAG